MPTKASTRRAVTNENDENAASTRLTRAKTGGLDSKVLTGVTQTRKRAALGDVSNTTKLTTTTTTSSKITKASTTKSSLPSSKLLKRSNSTRSVLTSKKPELKRGANDNVDEGTRKKRRSSDGSNTIQEAENTAPDAVTVAASVVKEEEKVVQVIKTPVIEADLSPYPPGVEDLDAEDEGDPYMTAEYVLEIFQHLKELEPQSMPNPNYIKDQPDLQWQMRGILVDWLLEVHQKFRLLPETLFLAVNIIDRFLTCKVCQLDRLQLVGVTALFLASKYEEVLSPHVTNFRHVADDAFTEEEILAAERFILRALEWNISQYPNPMNFLRRISKADNYDVQTRTIGKYLLEISCLDYHFLAHPPSQVSAAAMYLARKIGNRGEWNETISFYAGYNEEELMPCVEHMINYLSGEIQHEAFFKKYAHKKFLKVSIVVRNWVKENY